LLKNDFTRGQVDTTLFMKTLEKDILIVQVYVDDIIFRSTNASLCKEFSMLMQEEFETSMMGELKFFLGIQINQCKDGVYVHQSKYTKSLSCCRDTNEVVEEVVVQFVQLSFVNALDRTSIQCLQISSQGSLLYSFSLLQCLDVIKSYSQLFKIFHLLMNFSFW